MSHTLNSNSNGIRKLARSRISQITVCDVTVVSEMSFMEGQHDL